MIPLGSVAASATIALAGLGPAPWIGGLGTVLCLPALIRRGVLRDLKAGSRAAPQLGAGAG